ncbi:MAG: phospholipase D-like domain-containing protein [Candidatus Omnitrophota bacterium]
MITRILKKYLAVFLIALAVLGITAGAYCYQADVTYISGTEYFSAVKEAILKAEKSIDMAMYQVSLKPHDKESQVLILVDELVKAKNRGVKVRVILDQNIDFVHGRGINRWAAEGKNSQCFKILKEAGIDVQYDNITTYTHAKALVIDRKIVILGSANWSESAFNKNAEANVLIKSESIAKEVLESFKSIKIDQRANVETQSLEGGVAVSWKFLEDPRFAGRLLNRHDERAFDLYLVFLKEFEGNPDGSIILNYERIASYLGLLDKMTREGYRRQINRSLKKLKEDYGLIDFELSFGKDAKVRLLSYDDPKNYYSAPKEWYFQVPQEYWDYGWSRKLSQRAKLCYLMNLAYVSISNAAPWWFSSVDVLAKRFNVGKWVISKGMQELRDFNLIDAAYDGPQGVSYEERLAKSYEVLPLYDPAELELEWDRLEAAYGANKLKKAQKYGKIVFKQNDPQVVEDIVLSMDVFGEEKVRKAFDIVSKKNVDNSKRCYGYVKGLLEKL